MGMNRDFAVATEKGLAPATQLWERKRAALQLFQIESREKVSRLGTINGVKLPALLGNGLLSVYFSPKPG